MTKSLKNRNNKKSRKNNKKSNRNNKKSSKNNIDLSYKKKYIDRKLKQMCLKIPSSFKWPFLTDISYTDHWKLKTTGGCIETDESGHSFELKGFYDMLKKKYGPESYNPKNYKLNYNFLYDKIKP